jgi:hypothetical protein
MGDGKSNIEINSDFSFSGEGIFNGKNIFNNNGYSIIIGGKINSTGAISLTKDSKTYTLRNFSIINSSTNILTVFANGSAFIGGSIESFDTGDNIDYIYLSNGKRI